MLDQWHTWEQVKERLDQEIANDISSLVRFELYGKPAALAMKGLHGADRVLSPSVVWFAGYAYRAYRGFAVVCDPTEKTRLVVVRGQTF